MGPRKGRRAGLIAAALLAVLVVHDAAVEVPRAWGARTALAAIREYQAHVSPHLQGRVYCRFKPTCSHYGYDSIRKHGLFVGGMKTAWRVARCGPWTKMGTVDEP